MAIIGAPIVAPKIQTVSVSIQKKFTGLSVDGIVNSILPPVSLPDSERVKPSAIHPTKAGAFTMLGASVTPQSFANGAAWVICAHAWGQIKDIAGELKAAKVPAWAQFAIAQATDNIKRGPGIDAGTLRNAVHHAFGAVLSMPLTAPKVDGKESPSKGETIQGEAQRIESAPLASKGLELDRKGFHVETHSYCNSHGEFNVHHAARVRESEKAAQEAQAAQAAQAAQEAKAAQESAAPLFVEQFRKLAESQEAQALEMLREMASAMGFELRRKPAKKSA